MMVNGWMMAVNGCYMMVDSLLKGDIIYWCLNDGNGWMVVGYILRHKHINKKKNSCA